MTSHQPLAHGSLLLSRAVFVLQLGHSVLYHARASRQLSSLLLLHCCFTVNHSCDTDATHACRTYTYRGYQYKHNGDHLGCLSE